MKLTLLIKLMRLINKEVLKENKLKDKFYLLSSCIVDCTFNNYALLRNDRHAIDQKNASPHNSYA